MDNWLLSEIKRTVIGERRPTIAGRDIPYLVFRGTDATPDPLGANDREGTIYVSENVVKFDEHYAALTALHEQVECERKLKGRAYAYAHGSAITDVASAIVSDQLKIQD